jgi:hypothetical protein
MPSHEKYIFFLYISFWRLGATVQNFHLAFTTARERERERKKKAQDRDVMKIARHGATPTRPRSPSEKMGGDFWIFLLSSSQVSPLGESCCCRCCCGGAL